MKLINLFISGALFIHIQAFAANTTKYKIEGMTCGGCVDAVKAQVCNLEGVDSCNVKVGEVELSFKQDSKISTDKISEAVSKAGYSLKK